MGARRTLDRGPLNLDKREADLRLPLLRRAKDQVVERLADFAAIVNTRIVSGGSEWWERVVGAGCGSDGRTHLFWP